MMKRAILAALLAAPLSACGGGSTTASTDTATGTANTAVADSAAPSSSAATASVACENLPDHIALLDDAKVSLCTRGKPFPDRESGTIIYTTARLAADVLGWYKQRAHGAGFSDGLTTPATYSVAPKGGKSMMVLTEASGSGTQVTVNWGHPA